MKFAQSLFFSSIILISASAQASVICSSVCYEYEYEGCIGNSCPYPPVGVSRESYAPLSAIGKNSDEALKRMAKLCPGGKLLKGFVYNEANNGSSISKLETGAHCTEFEL